MSFKSKLYYIIEELEDCSKDCNRVFSSRVQERLDRALKSYSKSLDDSVTYLSARDSINLLKKMNRS